MAKERTIYGLVGEIGTDDRNGMRGVRSKNISPPPFRNQKIDFGNRCRELFPIARVFQK